MKVYTTKQIKELLFTEYENGNLNIDQVSEGLISVMEKFIENNGCDDVLENFIEMYTDPDDQMEAFEEYVNMFIDQGNIDNDDAEILIESASERVFMEKKTRQEYFTRKWKKDHEFIPDSKNPNIGTAIINGKRIKVDMDMKSNTIKDPKDGTHYPRSTSYGLDNDTMYFGKEIMRVKNNKRREAVVGHEASHGALHSMTYGKGKLQAPLTDVKLAHALLKEMGVPKKYHTDILTDMHSAGKFDNTDAGRLAMRKNL